MKNIFLVILCAGTFGAASFNKAAAAADAHSEIIRTERERAYIEAACAKAFENVKTIEDVSEATIEILSNHPNHFMLCASLEDDSIAIKWATALKRDFLFIKNHKANELSLEDCKEYAQNVIIGYFMSLRGVRYPDGTCALEFSPDLAEMKNDVFGQEYGPSLTEEQRAQAALQQRLVLIEEKRIQEALFLLALEEETSEAKRSKVDTPLQPPL